MLDMGTEGRVLPRRLVKSEAVDSTGELARRVAAGEAEAVTLLYERMVPGLRLFFRARRLDEMEAEDFAQEAFLEALERLRAGALDEPACFAGYLRTIAQRLYYGHLERRKRGPVEADDHVLACTVADTRSNPEQDVMVGDRRRLALEVLAGMSRREREVLTRFYLWEQDAETICREMGLTEDQFRLLKSRAKAKFGERGQRRLKSTLRRQAGRIQAA